MPNVTDTCFTSIVTKLGRTHPFIQNNQGFFRAILSIDFSHSSTYQSTCRKFINDLNNFMRFKTTITNDEIKTFMNSNCIGKLYCMKVFHETPYDKFKLINEAINFYGYSYDEFDAETDFINFKNDMNTKVKNQPLLVTLLKDITHKYKVFVFGSVALKMKKHIAKNTVGFSQLQAVHHIIDLTYFNVIGNFCPNINEDDRSNKINRS